MLVKFLFGYICQRLCRKTSYPPCISLKWYIIYICVIQLLHTACVVGPPQGSSRGPVALSGTLAEIDFRVSSSPGSEPSNRRTGVLSRWSSEIIIMITIIIIYDYFVRRGWSAIIVRRFITAGAGQCCAQKTVSESIRQRKWIIMKGGKWLIFPTEF